MINSTCRVVFASTLPDTDLDLMPLDPQQVLDGEPQVRHLPLVEDEAITAGVWQHFTGTSRDVEADEMFIVLSGRATIAVEGGPTLQVGPGDVGLLVAGARTVWTVHEPLRKVYIIRQPSHVL